MLGRLGLLAVLAAILAPASADAVEVDRSSQPQPRQFVDRGAPEVDHRIDPGQPSPRSLALPGAAQARVALRDELGPLGVVDVDARTGTPRMVAKLDGFLTARSDGPPEAIALAFVHRYAAAFGLDSGEIADLRVARRYTDVHGITHIAWEQRVDGVPVFEHGLLANVARDGRLISLLGAPVADLRMRSTAADLSAKGARGRASADVGTRPGASDDADLVVVADGPGRLRLAWRTLTHKSSTEVYDHLIDARSGDVILRRNAVDFAAGNVWEYAPFIHQVCAECSAAAGTQALHNFGAGGTAWSTLGDRLDGNYAHVYTDVNDDNQVDSTGLCTGCGEIPPSSGSNWGYNFTPFSDFGTNCGNPFPACSWDWFTANSWTTNLRQNGTQVYWFISNFHDWLAAPPFGFTAASGNFEGADRVDAQILDGANTDTADPGFPDTDHINNANMLTLPDGSAPRMQMYLFAPYFGGPEPSANGGDDASVIYHEYVHGLSNRLVTDASNNPALLGHHSRSMGEGWSDWYAMDYLEGNDLDETDSADEGEMNVGVYVQGGDIHALRTEGLDCEVGSADVDCPGAGQAGTGGYTLGDMGRILCPNNVCEPEFHADGEIWAQALWDVRQAVGAARARAIITEGMRLTPPAPSFLDARNGILQAETALGGANFAAVYEAFRGRGMGYFADAEGSNDTSPTEDFSALPACPCPTVSGQITDADTGAPIAGAVVEIAGGFGDLSALTDASGNYTIPDVPAHTYPRVFVTADGYRGFAGTNFAVPAGGAQLSTGLERNWASLPGGAQVTEASAPDFSNFGCGPSAAFDQSYASGWGSAAVAAQDPTLPDGPKAVTVQLPEAIDVDHFAVDPSATCGDDISAMVTSLKIETSPDGTTFTQSALASFTAGDAGSVKNVPATAATQNVRFVRFTMQANLGPGQGSSHVDFMDLTELEVYGSRSATPTPTPTVTATATATATATSTATATATATATTTATGTPTATPTATATDTATPTATATETATPTVTVTVSPTGVPTTSPTASPSTTVFPSPSPTVTPTPDPRAELSGLILKRLPLAKFAKGKPLKATVGLSAPAKIKGRLQIPIKAAAKLALNKTTIGGGSVTSLQGGILTVKLKASKKVQKALKKRSASTKSLKVTARLVATDVTGATSAPVSKAIKLKR